MKRSGMFIIQTTSDRAIIISLYTLSCSFFLLFIRQMFIIQLSIRKMWCFNSFVRLDLLSLLFPLFGEQTMRRFLLFEFRGLSILNSVAIGNPKHVTTPIIITLVPILTVLISWFVAFVFLPFLATSFFFFVLFCLTDSIEPIKRFH